ncbi:hypothetical protein PL11201_680203 [Planktothrix sp. PCC 11201]|nr:hypothetical protein PL11201_680203 [Planktothrix sp. PCC 11201]
MFIVEITYNPFQGLKHSDASKTLIYFGTVEITYNPFQGLKQLVQRLLAGEAKLKSPIIPFRD